MNCYKCATPLPDNSKFCLACGADVSGDHTHHTGAVQPDPELISALQAELGDDYKVEKELGRGGMAIVYLGHDKHLGRKVAIKLLPPMLTFGSGPGFIDRFKREARTAATLDHPHIIPVYRVSTGGKLFWYVMKFLEGESLDATLKRDGQFDVDRVVQIVTQTADALDHAHANKVVHRDVKPANIMLDKRGRVTVTDFGIAKALEQTAYTNSGATIGTPHYMAPEQCAGLPVSGAADQYALAVSAYQMLSGHLPFQADSILELMRMHSQDPPPPLDTLRPSLTRELVAAVERGLAKEPKDRFDSCGDFARALSEAAARMDAAARRPTAGVGPKTAEAIRINTPRAKTSAKPTVPATARGSSHMGLFVSATIFVVGVIATIVLWPTGSQPESSPPSGPSGTERALAPTGPVTPPPENKEVTKTTPPPAVPAKLELRGVPSGASVTRDGQRVAGTTFDLEPGKSVTFVVNAAGYEPWRRTYTPTDGQQLLGEVSLRPVQLATGNNRATGSQSDTKANTKSTGPANTPVNPPGNAPTGPAAARDTAIITVGSTTTSSIIINGKPTNQFPVRNYVVPAGRVVIRFQVTDTAGIWTVDTVVTLAPGENRNLGRIVLKRP